MKKGDNHTSRYNPVKQRHAIEVAIEVIQPQLVAVMSSPIKGNWS